MTTRDAGAGRPAAWAGAVKGLRGRGGGGGEGEEGRRGQQRVGQSGAPQRGPPASPRPPCPARTRLPRRVAWRGLARPCEGNGPPQAAPHMQARTCHPLSSTRAGSRRRPALGGVRRAFARHHPARRGPALERPAAPPRKPKLLTPLPPSQPRACSCPCAPGQGPGPHGHRGAQGQSAVHRAALGVAPIGGPAPVEG